MNENKGVFRSIFIGVATTVLATVILYYLGFEKSASPPNESRGTSSSTPLDKEKINPRRTASPPLIPQSDSSETGAPSESRTPLGAITELADLVVGTYFGAVMSDSKGSSRSDVGVIITKLDRSTVRVTSDYQRLGTVDIPLTRIGNQILNAEGDTPFIVYLDQNPPTLTYNPHNEVAYGGRKQK